jgi:hypothetical protein
MKKYILISFFFVISSMVSAQVVLPAYQGVFSKPIANAYSIITSGLILNLDASNSASYPGSGTVWTDLSGSSNNMSLLNGASYDSSNRNSILFDGVNDYAGRSSAMNTGQNFTVSVWMYATLLGSTRTSLVANSYNYSVGNGWFFCTNAGGTPNSFFLSIGSDNPVKVSSSNILTLNTWNYLTAVIRSGGRYIDLYKNGVLISGTSTDLGARTITYNYAILVSDFEIHRALRILLKVI